ncbi:MAG: CBS domain-containing protein [Betaproteobacteria bacterium]|nr:MAG: CBS domain-containing protein [Betaproteobacteria bacterium]
MKVSQAMTRKVCVAFPQQSIRDAAQAMAEFDIGALPVCRSYRLIGVITTHDLALRGLAAGRSPDTPVVEVMTREVRYCFEDEDIEKVVEEMKALGLRRLPVLDRGKRLVGILSLPDAAAPHRPSERP